MTKTYLNVRFINPDNRGRTYVNPRWSTRMVGSTPFLYVTYKDTEGKIITDYINPAEILSIRTYTQEIPDAETAEIVPKEPTDAKQIEFELRCEEKDFDI